MTDLTERTLGWGFGLLGAVLIVAGGLVAAVQGMVSLFGGHLAGAGASGGLAVVLIVIGALAGLFAFLGYRGWRDRPLVSGVLLMAIAVVGWVALGLGANLLALVGGLFVFLAGLLYAVGPAIDGARRALAPA